MSKDILVIKSLNVYCPTSFGAGSMRILDDVSLTIREHDTVGLVGETGAGKSVLIDAIGKNLKPPLSFQASDLTIWSNGKQESLLSKSEEELKKIWGAAIAFIPPNARDRLNPLIPVGDQFINLVRAHRRISTDDAKKIVTDMFRMVQMPDAEQNLRNYPHELSGGMAQRVVVSFALFLAPRLLLADEPTMGLDVTIQKQVLDLMGRLFDDLHAGVVIATRDLGIVANYCNQVAVLCNGQVAELSPVREFFRNARHPYSHYLLEAAFASHGMSERIDSQKVATRSEMEIKGERGCRFAGRCPQAKEMKGLCWSMNPPKVILAEDHIVRCHKVAHDDGYPTS